MNDLQSLIARLKKHNQWRRGEIELTQDELDPKQIGLDIDDVINYLEELQSEINLENYYESKDFAKLMAIRDKNLAAESGGGNRAPGEKAKPPEFISVNEGYYKD